MLRFTDTYSKVVGGQLQLAMDPPTADPARRRACSTSGISPSKGRPRSTSWRRAARSGAQAGIGFSRLRAEFIRQNGQLTIKEGVLKGPTIGGTIEGSIDYPGNQVRMSGTFVPIYGLNNMFGQIPVVRIVPGRRQQ